MTRPACSVCANDHPFVVLVDGVCGTCRDHGRHKPKLTCSNCAKTSTRIKLRDGLCGRCWTVDHRLAQRAADPQAWAAEMRVYRAKRKQRDPNYGRGRAEANRAYHARCRHKQMSGRLVYAAFDRKGQVLGVYSTEPLAEEHSNIVRRFQLDRTPVPQPKVTR
jgi:hypothetical protein